MHTQTDLLTAFDVAFHEGSQYSQQTFFSKTRRALPSVLLERHLRLSQLGDRIRDEAASIVASKDPLELVTDPEYFATIGRIRTVADEPGARGVLAALRLVLGDDSVTESLTDGVYRPILSLGKSWPRIIEQPPK